MGDQITEDTVIMPNVVENIPPYQYCQNRQSSTEIQNLEPNIIYETVSQTEAPYGTQPVEDGEIRRKDYSDENDFLSIVNFIHNL